MMPSNLLDRVLLHTGFRDREEADACVRTVLRALAPCVPESACQLIADRTAVSLDRDPTHRDLVLGVEEFVWRVAIARYVSRARALEEAHAVCDAVAATLAPGDRAELRRLLPRELASWFGDPVGGLGDARPVTPPSGGGHTLATGRAGSRHPLSESAPPAAQRESVARGGNPHQASKLSSGRTHPSDPMADSPPGSRSPLIGGTRR